DKQQLARTTGRQLSSMQVICVCTYSSFVIRFHHPLASSGTDSLSLSAAHCLSPNGFPHSSTQSTKRSLPLLTSLSGTWCSPCKVSVITLYACITVHRLLSCARRYRLASSSRLMARTSSSLA